MATKEATNTTPLIIKAVGGLSRTAPGQRCVLSGLPGSSKAYILSKILKKTKRPLMLICPNNEQAEALGRDLAFFLDSSEVLTYPQPEQLPGDKLSEHPEIAASRIALLYALATKNKPFIAVATPESLIRRVALPKTVTDRALKFEVGIEYERDDLLVALAERGYRRVAMVEERGEVSVRGAVIDLFAPPTEIVEKWPLRLEFFGDTLESIRTFDPSTQRSQRELAEAIVLPARQIDLSDESRSRAREKLLARADELGIERSLWEPLFEALRDSTEVSATEHLLPLFYEELTTPFDYLSTSPLGEPAIVLIEADSIKASTEECLELMEHSLASGEALCSAEELLMEPGEFSDKLEDFATLELKGPAGDGIIMDASSNLDLSGEIRLEKSLKPLRRRINTWRDENRRVIITAHNHGQAERMTELLEGVSVTISRDWSQALIEANAQGVTMAIGTLSTGFRWNEEALVVISEEEIFGERVKRRAPPAKKTESFLTELKDLTEGDPIVHSLHGIGIYRGLERMGHDGIEGDFMLIEYRDADRLYLPVERMDLVSKYHGVEGSTPKIDKLGSGGWDKTKKRVKKAVASIAGELIRLYAEREAAEGTAFGPAGRLFTEFEASFEYEETPDQMRAIDEVMADMSSPRPMDRLICGDVGYGKTEVAMRAAFRAVLDSRQVALLVPTTVLAQQHYITFTKRFAPYPVRVGVLSRFKDKREQQETLGRLRDGDIDIIIGTHRLLQSDVEFKELGLVIIDEEHRFGVKNKERLREIKKGVDTLTLTATPIPRTLHMSLADIRDLSIINTPPEDRLAITTRVISFDEERIREAIARELGREGQVFFVHNRVGSIGAVFDKLRRICDMISPKVKIAVGHGQMRRGELERVMMGFVSGEYDILLSTTIIESGLDIPRANTIIINRADRYGLAELYQLRGRVGRSRHRAYAYLISPEMRRLTPEAAKRMEVITELTELGSGFRIAAYDLEIRGAGELLGRAQSGKIAEVGFEMYNELLAEAVREIKGLTAAKEDKAELDLKIEQYIPEDYVPDTRQRLNIYKRLATEYADADSMAALAEELTDRYGPMPETIKNLFGNTEIKRAMLGVGARELTQKGQRLYMSFSKKVTEGESKTSARAVELVSKRPNEFRATEESRLAYIMPKDANPAESARYMLKELCK